MKTAICLVLAVLSTSICASEATSLSSQYFSHRGMLDSEGTGNMVELVLPK